MSDLYWLTDEQMARLQPYFPRSHGKPRVDDRRVLSGIIFINRNGLRWRDAPSDYGPAKTLYNRWKRWSDKGIFVAMMDGLASRGIPWLRPLRSSRIAFVHLLCYAECNSVIMKMAPSFLRCAIMMGKPADQMAPSPLPVLRWFAETRISNLNMQ